MYLFERPYISSAAVKVAPRKPLAAIVDMIRPLPTFNETRSNTRGTLMNPARILVVDDNSRHYGQIISSLVSSGYTAQIAETHDAALLTLHQQPFDLALIEAETATLDGLKVLAAIKADAALGELPVIMMSSESDLDLVISCIRLGAEDYLFNPLQGGLLKERIDASLARKASLDRERTLINDAVMLRSAARTLNTTLNPLRVMQLALQYAVERLKPSAGMIGTLQNGVFTVADSVGFGTLFATERQLPLSDMGWQKVLQTDRPYLAQQPMIVKDADGLGPYSSCYFAPIKRHQRPIAAMLLYCPQDESAEAIAFVEQLVEDVSMALWNAMQYKDALNCTEQYHTYTDDVSREMKLASTTIKEYTSLLRLDTDNVTHDMKARMLEAIRNCASHLYVLSTDLDKKKRTHSQPPKQTPAADPTDDTPTDKPALIG